MEHDFFQFGELGGLYETHEDGDEKNNLTNKEREPLDLFGIVADMENELAKEIATRKPIYTVILTFLTNKTKLAVESLLSIVK